MMDLPDGATQKINAGITQQSLIQAHRLKKSPSKSDQSLQLKKAARAFEAYFIKSLLKEMRKTQPQGSLFGGGSGKEIYQSLFDEKIAQKMAESGGIGLSKVIIKNLPSALKNSGESTDRREAINVYGQLHHSETLGVRNEDTRE